MSLSFLKYHHFVTVGFFKKIIQLQRGTDSTKTLIMSLDQNIYVSVTKLLKIIELLCLDVYHNFWRCFEFWSETFMYDFVETRLRWKTLEFIQNITIKLMLHKMGVVVCKSGGKRFPEGASAAWTKTASGSQDWGALTVLVGTLGVSSTKEHIFTILPFISNTRPPTPSLVVW